MTELTKLQCDRSYIEEVFRSIIENLRDKNSFEALVEAMEGAHKMKREEKLLVEQQKRLTQQIKELHVKITSTQKNADKQLGLRSQIIMRLQDKLHDEMVKGYIRNRYVTHWEKSREEQNMKMLGDAENELRIQLEEVRHQIDKESRINAEIETFLSLNHQNIEDSIENWRMKYEMEVEEMDATILKLKIKKDNLQEEFDLLLRTFQQQRIEIDQYLEFKEKQRLEKEARKILDDAATRIQAWWKGHLVRTGFGKYRKLYQKLKKLSIIQPKPKKKGGKKKPKNAPKRGKK